MNSITTQTLIEITSDFLAELENNSALMFSIQEIAVILEVESRDLADLLKQKDHQAYKCFQRGRLKEEALIRKSIFDLAKNGSSPAQAFAIKLIENAKMDDI